jgi:hypothetical protein
MWEARRIREMLAPAEPEPHVIGRDVDGVAARVAAAAAATVKVPHGGFGGLSTMPSPATGLISAGPDVSLGKLCGRRRPQQHLRAARHADGLSVEEFKA